jgi:hypothetical protein
MLVGLFLPSRAGLSEIEPDSSILLLYKRLTLLKIFKEELDSPIILFLKVLDSPTILSYMCWMFQQFFPSGAGLLFSSFQRISNSFSQKLCSAVTLSTEV